MPPTLILIRHAQALHNATQDYDIHDPELSEFGRQQCAELREGLMKDPVAQQAEVIITSPMRRTIQTALYSVDWLMEKGVKLVADAGWQENSAKPCDTGRALGEVSSEFPVVDFQHVDPVWPDKTSPAASLYHYTKTRLLVRAQASLKKLYERPEKVIIVVSHSAFMRLAVSGCHYYNADYRIFEFADMATPGGVYKLEQHASTKEKGGGLGYSWTDEVPIGSRLPEPESDAIPEEVPTEE
ncbi:histidine phosphatase superfamily [Xylariomycetidae sp. FL2044]|nr:histidine phosphatase superfamily [Xylariomycetidae sp. FL2044]